MQSIIKEQEMLILELEQSKNKIVEELEDFKTQIGYKNDQLNESNQKYEVKIQMFVNYKYIFVFFN